MESRLQNMETKSKIAAIIPAYNETRNIASILGVLHDVPLIEEIIVIDDGSLDDTAQKVQEAALLDLRIRLIRHSHNLGKGQAILTGRKETNASILLLLDADLKGITPQQVISLIEPVLYKDIDMTLGLFKGGKLLTDLSHWGAPWLSGQRAIRSIILDDIDEDAASGYGFETALTLAVSSHGWRKEVVWLRGVWHPPSEFHRGVFHGIWQRTRMYFQIIRAWNKAGGRSVLMRKSKKWIISMLILGSLFCIYKFVSGYYAAGSPGEYGGLPVLNIAGIDRILVIAPHPDDETLAAGGVIQQALAAGDRVKVMVVTNGDGQKFAPALLDDKVMPVTQDYIVVGERRQRESTVALENLGLRSEDMVFLGFPDRGTGPMWLADWRLHCPYYSVYTKAEKNPYPDTYDTGEVYCGSNLLNDIQNIIDDYKPDLVIMPHPSDQHPDHAAVSNFARMAIAMTIVKDAGYGPEIWGYIVHYGMFPEPRGKYLDKVLVPPRNLFGKDNHWGRLLLSPSDVSIKYASIQDYSSQIFLLGQFLPSFARSNELYESLPVDVLSPVSISALPVYSHNVIEAIDTGLPYTPNEEYPVKGNMFVGWQTVRLNNILKISLNVRRDVLPDLKCRLFLKLPSGETDQMELQAVGSLYSARVFWNQVDLTEFGDPAVIAFAAEIKQGGVLISKTGWHILILE